MRVAVRVAVAAATRIVRLVVAARPMPLKSSQQASQRAACSAWLRGPAARAAMSGCGSPRRWRYDGRVLGAALVQRDVPTVVGPQARLQLGRGQRQRQSVRPVARKVAHHRRLSHASQSHIRRGHVGRETLHRESPHASHCLRNCQWQDQCHCFRVHRNHHAANSRCAAACLQDRKAPIAYSPCVGHP